MGNRISESNIDPSGALRKTKTRVIDALNRLQQDIGGTTYAIAPTPTQAITNYAYDNNGNLTSSTDPLNRITTNSYDALNRLIQVVDPQNGPTKPTVYTYDQVNNLTAVTDPQGLTTSYLYNGHNNLITQSSPDTGSTQMRTNAMGNVTAKLDSMNRCSTTSYDNLHRVTSLKYYAANNVSTNTAALCFATIAGTVIPEETQSYTYDSITATLGGAGGKGRLSQISDAAGIINYVYDKNGRVISKSQSVSGTPKPPNPIRAVTYAYNASGQLIALSLPSGNTLAYSYGAANSLAPGKLIAITLNGTTPVPRSEERRVGKEC